MASEEQLKFINIAVTNDGLYGLTKTGDVWLFDSGAHLWKPLPMASGPAKSQAPSR
jgi:hypothetical protein